MEVIPLLVPFENSTTHGLAFLPKVYEREDLVLSVFAHGYTSHKGSLLTWASKLCDEGLPILLLDLPGHRLGHFGEVESFEQFIEFTPRLFEQGLDLLEELMLSRWQGKGLRRAVVGGHSLGGLFSLMIDFDALSSRFADVYNICVGLGLAPKETNHIFETPLFAATIQLRGQLVAPSILPEVVFPWIKNFKANFFPRGIRAHFLIGSDDVVVPGDGCQRFVNQLLASGNEVSIETVRKLPHHQPELASSFLKKLYLEKYGKRPGS